MSYLTKETKLMSSDLVRKLEYEMSILCREKYGAWSGYKCLENQSAYLGLGTRALTSRYGLYIPENGRNYDISLDVKYSGKILKLKLASIKTEKLVSLASD